MISIHHILDLEVTACSHVGDGPDTTHWLSLVFHTKEGDVNMTLYCREKDDAYRKIEGIRLLLAEAAPHAQRVCGDSAAPAEEDVPDGI